MAFGHSCGQSGQTEEEAGALDSLQGGRVSLAWARAPNPGANSESLEARFPTEHDAGLQWRASRASGGSGGAAGETFSRQAVRKVT